VVIKIVAVVVVRNLISCCTTAMSLAACSSVLISIVAVASTNCSSGTVVVFVIVAPDIHNDVPDIVVVTQQQRSRGVDRLGTRTLGDSFRVFWRLLFALGSTLKLATVESHFKVGSTLQPRVRESG
jgi:hypothetical protein